MLCAYEDIFVETTSIKCLLINPKHIALRKYEDDFEIAQNLLNHKFLYKIIYSNTNNIIYKLSDKQRREQLKWNIPSYGYIADVFVFSTALACFFVFCYLLLSQLKIVFTKIV